MHSLIPHLVTFGLVVLSPITVLAGNTYFTMTTPKVLSYADSITLTWEAESSVRCPQCLSKAQKKPLTPLRRPRPTS